MSSSELIRWGGLAAMLAGATFIVLMLIPEQPRVRRRGSS